MPDLTEAQKLLKRIAVYFVEGDDRVHLSIDGRCICIRKSDDPIAIALLKFDADQRAALESPDGA